MVLTRTQAQHDARRRRSEVALVGVETFTGVTGLAGGLLLAIRPDGSLLQARMSALAGSPFSDWRLPGLLLASLVGGGFLGAACWQWRGGPGAPRAFPGPG